MEMKSKEVLDMDNEEQKELKIKLGRMTLPTTSAMVVDLSGDDDPGGAVAAVSNVTPENTDLGFEKSCDNPECSAPKLISLVPKRNTPEFITEPVIINQPTLINGFTTVFQIDGVSARMNDIMNGDASGPSTSNRLEAQRPKSVFRIVPNTHAHIVNYVVVDGAGETMRKIKANDPETMRKLLDSQRLSAEQMLKKLMGKALKAAAGQTEPKVPPPISSKIEITDNYTQEEPEEILPEPLPAVPNVLPLVPPGITITPIPIQTVAQPEKSNLSIVSVSSSPQTPSSVVSNTSTLSMKSTAKAKETPSKKSTPPTIAAAGTNKPPVSTSSPSTGSAPVFQRQPVGSSASVSVLATRPAVFIAKTPQTPTPQQASSTTPSNMHSSPGRPSLKRKLAPSPTIDAIKKLRPRSPKTSSPDGLKIKYRPILAKPSTPLPPLKKLPVLQKVAIKPPTVVTTPVVHSTPSSQAPAPQARKIASCSKETDAELREEKRSPTSETNQLVTAKKTSTLMPKNLEPLTKPNVSPSQKPIIVPSSVEESLPSAKPKGVTTPPNQPNKTLPTRPKVKPLMGPASKMQALRAKAIEAAKTSTTSSSVQSKPSSTGTISTKTAQNSPSKLKTMLETYPLTKPCSVSIPKVDVTIGSIFKTNESRKEQRAPISKTQTTASKPNQLPAEVLDLMRKADAESVLKANIIPTIKTNFTLVKKSKSSSEQIQDQDQDPLTIRKLPTLANKDVKTTNTRASLPIQSKSVRTDESTHAIVGVSTPKSNESSNAKRKLETSSSNLTTRSTPRTTTATITPITKATASIHKANYSPSSSSPSSRMLRVKLATIKSGVMTIPVRSPHPNLKIASVISGGSAVAAATRGYETKVIETKSLGEESTDIKQLQQELADLKRTVARLNRSKRT